MAIEEVNKIIFTDEKCLKLHNPSNTKNDCVYTQKKRKNFT